MKARCLGRLVNQEGVAVVAFAEEEESEFGICWTGTANLVGCGGIER